MTVIVAIIIVAVAVVRMTPVARVVDVQVVIRPTDRICRRYTPEIVGAKMVARWVGVVITRIRAWVVVVHGARLLNDNLSRLIVRNINNLLADGHDLNDAFIVGNRLTVI
jgi:hypothetical protein